ncbi:hypothetical protein SAMN05421659_12418 [[Clostridium] fimetarium]|uniref:Uncharacterized protein n=1 Tax=[Clostridium] fimetarium TaxID=99656 RepID=A0A1I0RWA2_9FIRM|nr:hypothetical protein SAMN05421659_12418 [[Clostridium] fimetarium]
MRWFISKVMINDLFNFQKKSRPMLQCSVAVGLDFFILVHQCILNYFNK